MVGPALVVNDIDDADSATVAEARAARDEQSSLVYLADAVMSVRGIQIRFPAPSTTCIQPVVCGAVVQRPCGRRKI